uniref:Pyridine nucleotide-disulphide oxidoreductase dimerisation domain-containing protein n=1 Tax=Wuchereria bancrofti TaxID=6293 RepID=A0AAF5RTD1_WUCBA
MTDDLGLDIVRVNRAKSGKIIGRREQSDLILGFHILTPNAGEITQGFAIALKFDAKKANFDRLIGIHPTASSENSKLGEPGLHPITQSYN